MKKILFFPVALLLTALCLLPIFSSAQSLTQGVLAIGGASDDYGYSIITTTDGGYAISGKTDSYGQGGGSDLYVVKLNSSGAVTWTKTVGLWNSNEMGYSIVQTTDGGYAIAGYTGSTNDFFVVKLDNSGSMVWRDRIDNNTFNSADVGYSIVQTTDGGFAIGGRTIVNNANGIDWDVYAVKLTNAGAFSWGTSVGMPTLAGPIYKWDWGRCIIQTTDGGYALAGTTSSFSTSDYNTDFYVVKFNGAGALQWTKAYGMTYAGGSYNEEAFSIITTTDGGYAVAGYSNSMGVGGYDDFLIIKIDASGNKQWERTVGGAGGEYAYSIIQTADGGYAIAGETTTYGGAGTGTNIYLVKLNNAGSVQWAKTFGGNGTDQMGAMDYSNKALVQAADGGFAITGSTNSFGNGGYDVLFLKTNSAGDLCGSWNLSTGYLDGLSYASIVGSVGAVTSNGGSTTNLGTESSGGILSNSCLIILPVELLSFSGECKNNSTVELHWQTATEINNDYFTIERSISGKIFIPVGIVQGAGNSSTLRTYEFTDPLPNGEDLGGA